MASREPIRKRAGGGTIGAPPASTTQIPDKLYFRIGEVAKLCAVPAYVLRFWEGEFPQLKPNKGGTGQRLYRRRDVEMALRIKTLLYDEGYTIPGARQAFKSEPRPAKSAPAEPAVTAPAELPGSPQPLAALRKDLEELLKLLSRPAALRSTVQPIRPSFAAAKPEAAAPPVPRPPRPFLKPQLLQRLGPTLFDE